MSRVSHGGECAVLRRDGHWCWLLTENGALVLDGLGLASSRGDWGSGGGGDEHESDQHLWTRG